MIFGRKTDQNDLINKCASIIVNKLIKKIKESIFYSILCDETLYLAHIEMKWTNMLDI